MKKNVIQYSRNHGFLFHEAIIDRIKNNEDPPYRPRITEDVEHHDKMVNVMAYCWQDCPEARPDMHTLLKILIDINGKR